MRAPPPKITPYHFKGKLNIHAKQRIIDIYFTRVQEGVDGVIRFNEGKFKPFEIDLLKLIQEKMRDLKYRLDEKNHNPKYKPDPITPFYSLIHQGSGSRFHPGCSPVQATWY